MQQLTKQYENALKCRQFNYNNFSVIFGGNFLYDTTQISNRKKKPVKFCINHFIFLEAFTCCFCQVQDKYNLSAKLEKLVLLQYNWTQKGCWNNARVKERLEQLGAERVSLTPKKLIFLTSPPPSNFAVKRPYASTKEVSIYEVLNQIFCSNQTEEMEKTNSCADHQR